MTAVRLGFGSNSGTNSVASNWMDISHNLKGVLLILEVFYSPFRITNKNSITIIFYVDLVFTLLEAAEMISMWPRT